MASCTQSTLVVTCQPGSLNYRTSSGRLELVPPFCPFFACRGELIAWRMRAVTCMRARNNWAFRVPSGTPTAAAASEVVRPSNTRRRKATRSRAGSSSTIRSRVSRVCVRRRDSSALGEPSSSRSAQMGFPSSRFSSCWSSETKLWFSRRRSCILAEFSTMLPSHVENCASPLNWCMFLKADKRASWRASSASSALPSLRKAIRYSTGEYLDNNASNRS